MPSTGTCGFGTTFKGTTAGTVAQVRDIRGPNQTAEDVDISNNDSTSGYKEFVKGMIDGGEVTLDLVYKSAEGTRAETTLATTTEDAWTITLPEGSKWVFNGYVKGWTFDTPYKGEITCSLTLKVNGVPDFQAAV